MLYVELTILARVEQRSANGARGEREGSVHQRLKQEQNGNIDQPLELFPEAHMQEPNECGKGRDQ